MKANNKTNKCSCGHNRADHTKYVHGGKNKWGSRYVCTKDNCSRWAYCDLIDNKNINKNKRRREV